MSLVRWLLALIRPRTDATDDVASVLRRSSKPPTASADNVARARQRFMQTIAVERTYYASNGTAAMSSGPSPDTWIKVLRLSLTGLATATFLFTFAAAESAGVTGVTPAIQGVFERIGDTIIGPDHETPAPSDSLAYADDQGAIAPHDPLARMRPGLPEFTQASAVPLAANDAVIDTPAVDHPASAPTAAATDVPIKPAPSVAAASESNAPQANAAVVPTAALPPAAVPDDNSGASGSPSGGGSAAALVATSTPEPTPTATPEPTPEPTATPDPNATPETTATPESTEPPADDPPPTATPPAEGTPPHGAPPAGTPPADAEAGASTSSDDEEGSGLGTNSNGNGIGNAYGHQKNGGPANGNGPFSNSGAAED